jgi:UDP-N-acetylglucosamine--N-acetylmuramyl-(pentapeptide) pyrophosphoryl-undecaprenol N-acetylglucosamine transferase
MRLIIAAGGTGGHLYPGIAIAREFLRQEPATMTRFVGTVRGIEGKVLRHEGFDLETITAWPVMGLGVWQAFIALLVLPKGVWESIRILKRYRADLVVGIGGYTTPPVLLAAFLLGIPRVILEPNAYPGKANAVLGPLAQRVFLAFEAASSHFNAAKIRIFGVPVRRDFLETGKPMLRKEHDRTLLVFGGSRGAHAINLAMMEAISLLMRDLAARRGLSVIHQTGEADHEQVKAFYETAGIEAEAVPFLFDMPKAFRGADLVVSRAGAMTLAELTVCGKPAVLIPFPHAIYQHQAHNAQVMEAAGAAVVLPQGELTGARLAEVIGALLREPGRLCAMSERSRSLGKTDAAEAIVRECLALVKRESRG